MEKNTEKLQAAAAGDETDPGRREALLKIGKYGAYVAPAVLALVVGKKAEALSCSVC
jgi:hypothetical protein